MDDFRYPQFCALARAAELVGERWTLLVLRELFTGPQRFTDLRTRLAELSPSVLAQRVARLEERGLVRRRELPPPAASTVYELTADGLALAPALTELARWGARFLLPARAGERMEPAWLGLGLRSFARRDAVRPVVLELHARGPRETRTFRVAGGPQGVRIEDGPGAADASATGPPQLLLGAISGLVDPVKAAHEGRLEARGDLRALARLSELFDVPLASPRDAAPRRASSPTPSQKGTKACRTRSTEPASRPSSARSASSSRRRTSPTNTSR